MKLVFITLTAILFTLISKMGHAEKNIPAAKIPAITHSSH